MDLCTVEIEAIGAISNAVLALAAIFAGVWTWYHFRHAQRLEAAKWLQDLFADFYMEGRFANIRIQLEYCYDEEGIGRLIERRIHDRTVLVNEAERVQLGELDTLLNYFEFLLYLEDRKQLSRADREAIFKYWFDLMEAPQRAGLRRYIACFGFERIAAALNVPDKEYVAFYGSLMSEQSGRKGLPLDDALERRGHCSLRGRLLDLGEYPALVAGSARITAEYYAVKDFAVFKILDKFEKYDPSDPDHSLFIRLCIRLEEPAVDAWVYFYHQDAPGAAEIASGNWQEHLKQRRSDFGSGSQ